jgi:hypothetical protein
MQLLVDDVYIYDEPHGPEYQVTDNRANAVHPSYVLNYSTLKFVPDLADDPTLIELLWQTGYLRSGNGYEMARQNGWLAFLAARGVDKESLEGKG